MTTSPLRLATAISAGILVALAGLALATNLQAPLLFYYGHLLSIGLPLGVTSLAAVVLARRHGARHHQLELVERWGRSGRAAIVMVAGTIIVALLVFGGAPYSMDEYAELFQAQIFAHGQLVGQLPPALLDRLIEPQFQGWFFLVDHHSGAVISAYWPGYALLLAPFVAIGAPWLLGALLGAGSLLLIGGLTRRLVGPASSVVATVMVLASPLVVFNAASLFPTSAHLLAGLLFATLMLRGQPRDLLAAGLVGSLALNLHNPIPHIAFATPWLLHVAYRPGRVRNLATLAVGYLPGVLAGLAWFSLQSTITAANGAASMTPSAHAAALASLNLSSLSTRFWDLVLLHLWSAPALPLLAVLGLRIRGHIGLRLLAASFGLTVLIYLAFPYDQGIGWGPRYYLSAWGALPILAAAFLSRAPLRLRQESTYAFVVGGLLSLVVASGLVGLTVAVDTANRPLPGAAADVRFMRSGSIRNDPFARGSLEFTSTGAVGDRAFMERWFPAATLVGSDARGSAWQRH